MAYSRNVRRFGTTSVGQRQLGVTTKRLEVVVAVAACQAVHGGYPTRTAVQQVTRVSDSMFSAAVGARLIYSVELTDDGFAVYGVSPMGKELLRRAFGPEAVAAE